MAVDRKFCELFDMPFSKYALDGCIIGHPDAYVAPSSMSSLCEVSR
jgi:hypothetical protein